MGSLWLGLQGGADLNQAGPEAGVGTYTSRALREDVFPFGHELNCRLVSFPVQYLVVEEVNNRKSLRPNRSGEEADRCSSITTLQCADQCADGLKSGL